MKINQYAEKFGKILHMSHRGGSRERLENTIESFTNAANLGSNVFEMDLCLTKDKKIVVIHDSWLKRMTGQDRHVCEFNYADLPQIQDIVTIDFTVHQKFDTTKSTHKYFPLFEDVLRQFPSTPINMEIKTPTEEFLQKIDELIRKYKREDITIWGCRPPKFNKRIHEVNPNVQRWFNEVSVVKTYFCFMLGLLPFISLDENTFQAPIYTIEYHDWKKKEAKTIVQKLKVWWMFFFIYIWTKLGVILFTHLKKRGVAPYLWVLNTNEEFQQAVDMGALGIMTDSPTKLKDFLIAKNKFIQNSELKVYDKYN